MATYKVKVVVELNYEVEADTESEAEALELALSTWPENIVAITHYSDSRKVYEDDSSKLLAHTDWIWNDVETYGFIFDIEFEVKQKYKSLLRFINEKSLV
jgi:hypothetical protein